MSGKKKSEFLTGGNVQERWMPQGDQDQGWIWMLDLAAGKPVVTSASIDSAQRWGRNHGTEE